MSAAFDTASDAPSTCTITKSNTVHTIDTTATSASGKRLSLLTLAARNDSERRERIRKQIKDLEERYKAQKEAGTDRPVDEWTSRPLIVAFLPTQTGVFFERAGTDVVLRREIADRLNRNARTRVVDREMLDELLQELNLGSSELADGNTQLRLGKVLAAQLLGFVEFAQAGPDTSMFVRMVDTETTGVDAQLVHQVPAVGSLEGMVTNVVQELFAKITASRPLQGLIANVAGAEILINLGAAHGVQVDQQFAALAGGAAVEVSGRTLHRNMRQVATLRVTQVEDELSACELVPGTKAEGVTLAKEMKIKELGKQE